MEGFLFSPEILKITFFRHVQTLEALIDKICVAAMWDLFQSSNIYCLTLFSSKLADEEKLKGWESCQKLVT